MDKPLAYKMAPVTTKDVVGQEHLLGKGKVLRNLLNNKKLFSMILYGGPGIGKTSIAKAIVTELDIRYRLLNAVVNSKKDFEVVFEEAKLYGNIVLIVDEIHRLNKDKQDLLLPYLENGLVILIGLTTSNPYHAINPAIRSRCQIYRLEPLTNEDIIKAIKKTIKSPYLENITIDKKSIEYIANVSNSDLRFAYNLLEVAYYSTDDGKIDIELLKEMSFNKNLSLDKNGDGYFDLLSALQKSIRGSDVDASLHYLARLIVLEDLESICRRLSVIAYEDISLANPMMGVKVVSAIEVAKTTGFPEARIPLAQIVIEMALSPKSNSAYSALDTAIEDVLTNRADSIPDHIKNHKNSGYLYPHDYPNNYVYQRYLPDNLRKKKYYKPGINKYEKELQILDQNIYNIKQKNNFE